MDVAIIKCYLFIWNEWISLILNELTFSFYDDSNEPVSASTFVLIIFLSVEILFCLWVVLFYEYIGVSYRS